MFGFHKHTLHIRIYLATYTHIHLLPFSPSPCLLAVLDYTYPVVLGHVCDQQKFPLLLNGSDSPAVSCGAIDYRHHHFSSFFLTYSLSAWHPKSQKTVTSPRRKVPPSPQTPSRAVMAPSPVSRGCTSR